MVTSKPKRISSNAGVSHFISFLLYNNGVNTKDVHPDNNKSKAIANILIIRTSVPFVPWNNGAISITVNIKNIIIFFILYAGYKYFNSYFVS